MTMTPLTAVLALSTLTGCSMLPGSGGAAPKPTPLTPQAFIAAPRPSPAPAPAPAVQPTTPQPPSTPTVVTAPPNNPVLATATTPAASRPAIGASEGQFLTLGGIVADVNGTPIHANKILQLIDAPLRAKAQRFDRERFRREAAIDIQKTIKEQISNELEYAAAKRNLDPDDYRLADASTMMWRLQQITQAGGSLELARRRAAERGFDFDEQTQEQQRIELIRIYYQKKIVPLIQVGAADLREYYDRNVDREFTENEKVKFRLIKVDIKKSGGKDAAIIKAADKLKRAKAGEDFAAMATRENDETMFAGQLPFEVSPKSFAIVKVREALGKLNPGEVSDLITDADAFYIVKLEQRVGGRVRPFEEQAVQAEIKAKLRARQYTIQREKRLDALLRDATIRSEPEMKQIALDMAMQRYAQYAAK